MNAKRFGFDLCRFTASALMMLACILFGFPGQAYSWGERGHDLVTRAAVRNLHQRLPADNGLTPALIIKEHQLSHLANVPDIVWRNMTDEVRNQNGPTHFIDVDFISTKPTVASMPRSIADAMKALQAQCAIPGNNDNCAPGTDKGTAVFDKVGTAPWRIEQLALGLEEQWSLLKKLQEGKADAKAQQAAFDEAIKYAGLISHFVGDLSQPLHTSKNYDGWETGQGGVHAYFETDVVNEISLKLDLEVLDISLKQKPFERIMKGASPEPNSALTKSWALVVDSWSQLSLLLDLDKRSLISKSQQTKEGLKLPAKRKPADVATKVFHSLIVQRMATGADVLADIWLTAWQNAGKPDLRTITSYTYFYAPEYIPAGYLKN